MNEAAPLIMAQSWLRCSEIADKDMFKKKTEEKQKTAFLHNYHF